MTNIKTLRPSALTPEVLLQHVAEQVGTLKEMYVVGVDQEGGPIVWSTGDLTGLSFAALVLQDLAFKQLNGQIIQD